MQPGRRQDRLSCPAVSYRKVWATLVGAGRAIRVSTVVGMRNQAQVAETLHRANVTVPDALWPALRAAGLIELGPGP